MAVARMIVALVVLPCLLVGCATDGNQLDGTEWVLVEMGPPEYPNPIPPDKEVTLEFVSGENRITGSLVNNAYSVVYEADESRLTVGQPGELWSEPPEHMQLEHGYLDALRKAEWYVVDGDRLTIDCGVTLLVYARK